MSLCIHFVCCRGDRYFRTDALLRWGSPAVRRGCHRPPGIRPFFRSESSVAACLCVTVVAYICVRIIGVFQQERIKL